MNVCPNCQTQTGQLEPGAEPPNTPPNTPYLRLMALADGADLTITHTFRRRTCTLIARNLRGVAVAGVSIPYLSFADSCEEMIRTLRGEV